MCRRFAYVLYSRMLASYVSRAERPTPFRDEAKVFDSYEDAAAAAPSRNWEPLKVLVHVKDGRVVDVEPWES